MRKDLESLMTQGSLYDVKSVSYKLNKYYTVAYLIIL